MQFFGFSKILGMGFLSAFLFILLISTALAIGISPPTITADYEEGAIYEFDIKIINNAQSNNGIQMRAEGIFADYVDFSKDQFQFKSNQGFEMVKVIVRLPPYDELEAYGPQRIVLRASEGSTGGSGFFAVTTAVSAWFTVDIPVPGQYGTIDSFTMHNALENENARFDLVLRNRGTLPLENTQVQIQTFDFQGQPLDTFNFLDIDMGVEEDYALSNTISTSTYDSSIYSATASFIYDPTKKAQEASSSFFIGSTDIQLLRYTKNLTAGKISEVALELQSLWGSPLKNIRGTVLFNNAEQSLPVLDFEPFEKKKQVVFLDLRALNQSSLDATLNLEIPVSDEFMTNKQIPLSFNVIQEVEPAQENPLASTSLIVVILIIVVVALIGFNIFMLKKRKK